MATAVLSNTVRRIGGDPQAGVVVVIELLWDPAAGSVAKDDANDFVFADPLTIETDPEGHWSHALTTNTSIHPTGSVYKITETIDASVKVYYASLTANAWLGDCIITTPSWVV